MMGVHVFETKSRCGRYFSKTQIQLCFAYLYTKSWQDIFVIAKVRWQNQVLIWRSLFARTLTV